MSMPKAQREAYFAKQADAAVAANTAMVTPEQQKFQVITEADKAGVHQLFSALDANGSNSLENEEIKEVLKAYYWPKEYNEKKFMDFYDSHGASDGGPRNPRSHNPNPKLVTPNPRRALGTGVSVVHCGPGPANGRQRRAEGPRERTCFVDKAAPVTRDCFES